MNFTKNRVHLTTLEWSGKPMRTKKSAKFTVVTRALKS